MKIRYVGPQVLREERWQPRVVVVQPRRGAIDSTVSDRSPCLAELKRFDTGVFDVASG